jgi:hypothetical protein
MCVSFCARECSYFVYVQKADLLLSTVEINKIGRISKLSDSLSLVTKLMPKLALLTIADKLSNI